MKKKVRVFVNSAQQYDDFSDQITTNALGEYTHNRNQHIITYTEKMEGDAIVNNVLTLKKEGAELQRSGAVSSVMKFDVGATTETFYGNQYGQLDFKVSTTRYDVVINEDKINVFLHYDMFMNSQRVSRNILQISIDYLKD